jgi:hypothetical protein
MTGFPNAISRSTAAPEADCCNSTDSQGEKRGERYSRQSQRPNSWHNRKSPVKFSDVISTASPFTTKMHLRKTEADTEDLTPFGALAGCGLVSTPLANRYFALLFWVEQDD